MPPLHFSQAPILRWLPVDYILLLMLLAVAIVIRLAFFNGPFGSDDLVYLSRAVEISNGIWSSANYNGSLRYGFNIPAGFFVYLFGINLFAVNLWTLLCSLAEIVVVYLFARTIWNQQTAFYSTLIFLSIPLHIAVSTRIHADSVVSLFVTLSFVLFFIAERLNSRILFFLTGLSIGFIFWVKELVIITLLAFIAYPIVFRRLNVRWIYIFFGGLVMLFLHFILMIAIAGDPLHLFKVVLGQIDRSFIQGGQGEDGVLYYFWYLFVDIKHTWLAPFLSFSIVFLFLRRFFSVSVIDNGVRYTTFWLISLIAILSFTPVSLEPLRFVMKQSNYLTLFLAPIALLSGYQVAQLSQKLAFIILVVIVTGGIALGAFEQQAYQVFTSNSKAALEVAKNHPKQWFIGSTNNGNIVQVYSILEQNKDVADRFGYLSDTLPHRELTAFRNIAMTQIYVIIDHETIGWGAGGTEVSGQINLDELPKCWQEVSRLIPTGLGLGSTFVRMILNIVEKFPEKTANSLAQPFRELLEPKPAIVYRVDGADLWCGK